MTANLAIDESLIIEARRLECELDGLYFNRYFLKQRLASKMIIGRHHPVMQATLDRTMLPPDDPDFIPRLIINVPPGYTKTELASIGYMARGLAINPRNRFMHLSYSKDLALQNSAVVREIIKSRNFQDMWSIHTKDDQDSKSIWWTDQNGGIRAASAKGQVTGFRAGHMDDTEFTGALLIDDPVKPDDAYSETIREGVNDNYNETIASRVAVETVPIIVIMQRIHYSDLSGYLLTGGSGEQWHHLNLPVKIDNSEPYPEEYTHGIPIEHGLEDGWLWPFKHNEKHEKVLKAHRRRYKAQYKQAPVKRDEDTFLWDESMINRARALEITGLPKRTIVAVDPNTKDTEAADEAGIVVGTEYPGNKYSIDADYSGKMSPLGWAQRAIQAYTEHKADAIVIETNQGGDMCELTLRNAGFKGRVITVHAKKGKTLRAEPVVALYELGVIRHKAGLGKLEDEQLDFDPLTQKSNGRSPNRVDAAVYVIIELAGIGDELGDLLDMILGTDK